MSNLVYCTGTFVSAPHLEQLTLGQLEYQNRYGEILLYCRFCCGSTYGHSCKDPAILSVFNLCGLLAAIEFSLDVDGDLRDMRKKWDETHTQWTSWVHERRIALRGAANLERADRRTRSK